ncbi:hypothetical protein [Paenibacillus tundrae]|uniref:Uncharacterized protein n=1 Tax=Paenibacillus tundrae TaxID=528187 RepID=A0ABT9W7P9_9BACL|nr:hypothetical protein [Paenibacillus tundrae]MDQ0169273.1 hypothetical protein [Paenibacillus tundrae]
MMKLRMALIPPDDGKRKSTTMGALLLRILVPDKTKADVDYVRMK